MEDWNFDGQPQNSPECSCETGKGFDLILDSEGVLEVKSDDSNELELFVFKYFSDSKFKADIHEIFSQLPACMQKLIAEFDDTLEFNTYSAGTGYSQFAFGSN